MIPINLLLAEPVAARLALLNYCNRCYFYSVYNLQDVACYADALSMAEAPVCLCVCEFVCHTLSVTPNLCQNDAY